MVLLQPVTSAQKVLGKPGLVAAWLRFPVVLPPYQRGQGHQNRLGAPARLQAKQRATVVHQVELNVAPPAVQLEVPLAIAPGHVQPAPDNGLVGIKVTVADRPQKGKILFEIARVVIIEEQPANTPGFLSVPEIEILVAPLA